MTWEFDYKEFVAIAGSVLAAIAFGLALGTGHVFILAVFAAPVAVMIAAKMPGIIFALHLAIPYYKAGIDDYLPVDATAVMAAWSFLATAPVIADLARGRFTRAQIRALGLWLLPLGLLALGSLYAVNRNAAIADLVSFATLVFGAGLLGLRIASKRAYLAQFTWTLFCVFLSSVIAGFFGIGDLGSYERLQSLGSNTIFSARAGISAALIAVLYIWARPTLRPFVVPLSLISVYVAMSTGSRGPLIMGLLTLALLWFISTNHKTRFRHLIIGVSTAMLVMVAPLPVAIRQYVPEFALGRITNTVQNIVVLLTGGRPDFDTSEQARITLWQLAIDMFQSRPLAGWGTGSFSHFTTRVSLEHITYPHNIALQFMAEFGGLGILVMLATFGPALRNALRPSPDPLLTTVSALFVFNVMNALVSNGIVDNRLLWGLLLVVIAVPQERTMIEDEHMARHTDVAHQPSPYTGRYWRNAPVSSVYSYTISPSPCRQRAPERAISVSNVTHSSHPSDFP